MTKYSYKISGLFKTDAQVAGEFCETLTKSKEGLTPKTLLDASRAENAPLHGEFEWDDSIAAESYREEQAKRIIRNIVVVTKSEASQEEVIRSFVAVPKVTPVNTYIPIRTVLDDEKMRASLLETAKMEMKSFISKYSQLKQLASVIDEMRKVC